MFWEKEVRILSNSTEKRKIVDLQNITKGRGNEYLCMQLLDGKRERNAEQNDKKKKEKKIDDKSGDHKKVKNLTKVSCTHNTQGARVAFYILIVYVFVCFYVNVSVSVIVCFCQCLS